MFQKFLNLPRLYKRLISVAADVMALSFALWASFALRLDQWPWVPSLDMVLVCGLTVVFTVGLFVRLGLYRAVVRYLSDKAFGTVVLGVISSALALIFLGFWFEVLVPRSVPVIYAALAFIFVAGSRLSIRMIVSRPLRKNKERVIIVGAGETGLQLCQALQQGTEFHPVAFISFHSGNHKTLINGLPVYDINYIETAVSARRGERLLLALDADSGVDRRRLLRQLEPLSVPVQTVPSMSELVAGQKRINDIRDLEIEDLLGRDPVRPDNAQVAQSLQGKAVMVTGAGGSIGSELCRQIIQHRPKSLVLFEQSEFSLYSIERELQAINDIEGLGVEIHPLLGNVAHRRRCEAVMKAFGVNTVYHAAAYKHVPLVEHNIIEGVQNNVFGTWHTAEAAIAAGVERFVLISTDKAVRPTNVMGASKRMAELVLQGLARRQSETVFSMVRFGNVLGSSGSVVPLFRDQIRDGGPVTVTHPDIIRYFMTIPEASQLVLQAGSMGQGGEVFVLDMGEPVKIVDLARKMIHLMGLDEKDEHNPDGDIEIVFSGLRPGEKLYEELLIGNDPQGTAHPRIMMAREVSLPWEELEPLLARFTQASHNFDCQAVVDLLQKARTAYTPSSDMADLVWCNLPSPETPAKVLHLS
ncbi:NDP-sugar epimerase, includes UDP-GlcNAc-inverting 4,6-dehydratase FlaA1 and capsular polysaccharide biosynthesis protein EpsC [Marinobacter persicus]|uniref:NDP-sugar epimerase, includes UDP-GlcNAc-inverting 4,6-dehydratase FlaA1 and capsular polysaccharide biosynthesis protein EpsC n=1 Tax=Marinobacter persicus TaxID=930118 RepID=A0A1I3PCJ4_9GAMM|nr:nucleoside-diphosphate sugar epimerase/dehydratase [Marinobacter persicus]GHD53954.1 nucleoside-diphosphate sugar epimerase [Marinobacter persicus]SFJ19119.1 NDP-sugar epimerase, includes UDP-GlcNAc-inverting 4,6-dehydratase FlaA1 and capsular polysaccharide biosynthesis protein EpsC [Marinobacter persicus]